MNRLNNEPVKADDPTRPTPLFSTDGWHRFVTVICLLACAGLVLIGMTRLIDPTEGRVVATSPMDYIGGSFFILLGFQGCRFLVRQLRAKNSTSPRRQKKGPCDL